MTAEIGRVLGGRYRLIAPIGMGASAQVYLADDVKLRRRVALKMLHDALADDADFLRRFRAEARAAAALSHPNVMAVYDWGDGGPGGDTAFIVTEYLSGGSLRALLDGDQTISPAQALGVGLEAARALDYAHRRGFVHRDIKPANLLFGEEQRLRIADFGLARALAEAAWTEPQGAVLGTARYASPEQAKGETLTGKADVYSLALVLVEAVTGVVPFVADTTLGTLMARVDRVIPVDDALGPLQEILIQAGHPDPEQRIDARALATGLLAAATELSRPEPLSLAGALADADRLEGDVEPTVHGPDPVPTEGMAPAEATDLTDDDLELGPPDWVNQARAPRRADAVAATTALAGHRRRSAGDTGPPTEALPVDELIELDRLESSGEVDLSDAAVASPTWAASSAAPAAVDLTGPPSEEVATGSTGGIDTGAPDAYPDGVATDGHPVLVAAGGGPGSEVPVDELDPGDEPDPVGEAGHGRRRWPWVVVILVLLGIGGGIAGAAAFGGNHKPAAPSAASVTLPVPALTGQSPEAAQAVVQAAGWKAEATHTRRDGTTAGQVLGTEPASGSRLRAGRTVRVVVSDGQTMVKVPSGLVGPTTDDAVAALAAIGLKGQVADQVYDEKAAKGTVVALAGGTAPELEKGSTVGLVASKGPRPRRVPDGLVGTKVAAATSALADVQLKIAITSEFSDSVPEGEIISTKPAAGASVARDSAVAVVVSKGPNLVAVPDVSKTSTLSAAVALLKQSGLQDGSVSGPASGAPKGTTPRAASMVRRGTTVDIVLG